MSTYRRKDGFICSACTEDIEQGGHGDGGHACECEFVRVTS